MTNTKKPITIREFKARLEESLDSNFPKGKCKERGAALMVYADAVMLAHQLTIDPREAKESVQ